MSDRAWQMYEDSGKGVDEREFVSHLVSKMDNQMLKYLAAKGMLSMAEQSKEPEPLEMSDEEILTEEEPMGEILPDEAEGELPENPDGNAEQELSNRDKINRLLTQND